MKQNKMRFAVVSATLLLLAAQGCSLNPYHSPYPSRPANYPISITEFDYEEPYVVIREVTTSAYDDRMVETRGKNELQAMARRLGGDAVIQVTHNSAVTEDLAYRPTFFWRIHPRFVNKTSLTGVVVRFER